MKFKVGDRVRIACPVSSLDGKVGTVWAIHHPPIRNWDEKAKRDGCRWWHAAYCVDVDGVQRPIFNAFYIAFPHFNLRPATDPRAEQFIADMKRFASAMKSRSTPLHPTN